MLTPAKRKYKQALVVGGRPYTTAKGAAEAVTSDMAFGVVTGVERVALEIIKQFEV